MLKANSFKQKAKKQMAPQYTYNVPSMAVLERALSVEQNLARPKSAIFGLYLKSNKMLLALMSL